MKFDAFVANRYLKAKRKQSFIGVISIITLLGITLGTAALDVALSVHNGMRGAFVRSLVGDTGTLHIVAGSLQTKGFSPEDLKQVVSVLDEVGGVESFALLRREPGVAISTRRRLQYVNLHGILPDQYLKTGNNLDVMESGHASALKPQELPPYPVIIGHDLARHLGVRQGDELKLAVPRIASPGLSASGFRFKEMKCEVAGIFRTGNSQFDERDAFLHMETLFMLLNTSRAKEIMVRYESLAAMERAKQKLIGHPGLPLSTTVVDFRDLNQELLNALDLEKLATTSVISLFILVVALNMVSALIMLVMEKHRDIGIMKSFGVPSNTILRIFIRQGMTLSLWGTMLGTALGVSIALVFDHFRLIRLDNAVYEVLNYLPFKVQFHEVALVFVGSLLVSFVTTIYPAKQAAALDPVEALKYD